MGDTLAGTKKWEGLLKTTDTEPLDASKRVVSDGEGNDSGLGLSQTKVWANELNIENATLDSAENTTLVIKTNGDVRTREMNPNVFNGSLVNRFFAKTTGAQDSPLPFSASGVDSAASVSVGENLALDSATTAVVVSGAGLSINVQAEAKIKFLETDAEGTISIAQNGTAISTRNVINNFAATSAEDIALLSFPFTTSTSADEISFQFSSTSGTIRILENSILDVQILD